MNVIFLEVDLVSNLTVAIGSQTPWIPLIFSVIVLVTEIHVLEKDHFSKQVLKLFFNSIFLTKFSPQATQTQRNLKSAATSIKLIIKSR